MPGLSDNTPVIGHRQCRFAVSGGERGLTGLPAALPVGVAVAVVHPAVLRGGR